MVKPWHNEKLITTIKETLKKKEQTRLPLSPFSALIQLLEKNYWANRK